MADIAASGRPRTFQFLSIQKPPVTAKLLNRLLPFDATIIMDLEDGLWDPVNPDRTPSLKAQGRNDLLGLIKTAPGILARQRIGVRVNRLASPEFSHDLATLKTISQFGVLSCIVLTKIESVEDIDACIDHFATSASRYDELIPIVETRLGLHNLKKIVAAANHRRIRCVVYGHYDYSLDAGHWPFLEHDEGDFWKHVTPIIHEIENGGLSYVHPPYFQMYDDAGFTTIIQRLRTLCRREFGVLTVALQQTRISCVEAKIKIDRAATAILHPARSRSEQESIEFAEHIKMIYEQNRRPNYGFVIDPHAGRFVSAHEYIAASSFLKKLQIGG